MTAAWTCDGPDCSTLIRKDAPRLALVVVKPPPAPLPMPDPEQPFDPNEINDALQEINIAIELPTFGFDSDHDFCSPACLAAWAFANQLDGLPDGEQPTA